jgi:hypothetical protein
LLESFEVSYGSKDKSPHLQFNPFIVFTLKSMYVSSFKYPGSLFITWLIEFFKRTLALCLLKMHFSFIWLMSS